MSDFTEAQWARAGRGARARAEAVRGPIRRAVAASKVKGLAGVTFASDRARELALEAGLAWLNFENVEESAAGGYTADDVRRIIRELEG